MIGRRPYHAAIPVLLLLTVTGCAAERSVATTVKPQASAARQDVRDRGPDCLSGETTSPRTTSPGPGAAPAPPGPAPPNASRIVADVLKRSVWAPGTLPVPPLPSNPDRSVSSVTLSVVSSRAEAPEYENLMLPGSTVEAFSCSVVPPELTGKRIEAVATLAGDTRATRWWVSEIRVLP